MNLLTPLSRPGPALLLSATLAVLCLVPQARAESPGAPPATVPELFAGELDDVGPQYLLLAKPRAQSFNLWSDLEITGTSNATLVETNPTFSTITSAQAGLIWQAAQRPLWDGIFRWEVGGKAQAYRYGYLTGVKQLVNFIEIDRNNFDLLGAHLRADWQRDRWLAALTLRGSTMRSTYTHRVFYDEVALEWQVYRHWSLASRRTMVVGLEGAYRVSETDSYGLLPEGYNDRVEQGVVVILDQALGARWHLQPAVRVLATRYTDPSRNRTDWHESARLALVYAVSKRAELRFSVGYERRDSSELLIADFRKWDLALGASGHWRF